MSETVLYVDENSRKAATLFVLDKTGSVRKYPIRGTVTIGRVTANSTADISLDSSIASRKHGEFVKVDDTFYYRDLGSSNGTFVNGKKIGGSGKTQTVALENGDILRIDSNDLHGRHPEAVLMIFSLADGDTVWHEMKLKEETGDILIGRDVDEAQGMRIENEAMSRKHATFMRGVQGWAIIDHGSTNGVFLNNRRIGQPMLLFPLDTVRILDNYYIFTGDKIIYNAPTVPENRLKIRIRERVVKNLMKKRVLLQDIQMTIDPGEMILILGGSGAGKTTFMNAIMGYEKADGTILYGDVNVYRDYSRMKYQIGFVPQQDLLRLDDTVLATLMNAAQMKMPSGTSAEARMARVEEVLELLGLQRERDSLVKKLSGGQKKRLSIAVEFISDPGLFFLDEPDSGLDGVMAMSLIENLRIIADSGKIVMVITHAPDRVAHLFNKVLVLAKSSVTNSGHMAFFGTIDEAKEFFETDSLEGVVRRINRPDEGGDGLSDFYIEKYESRMRGENR